MNFTKVISTSIDKVKRRIVKILVNGLQDVQTSKVIAPYGIDSHPVKNLIAVYAPTSVKGKTIILGYINKNDLAAVGELRLYSTDSDGVEKISHHLKNDGTMEIGGNGDNMVRFIGLDNGLQNQDAQIQAELVKIQTAIAGLGGAYVPGNITTDISASKIDRIKTLS